LWEEQAAIFGPAHDRGNSHSLRLASYQRMLEVFEPLWAGKLSDHSMGRTERYVLGADELAKIYKAWPAAGPAA
jgi:hypothetical protein